MPSLEEKLLSIKPGKSKRIRGLEIGFDGNVYEIDGCFFNLDESVRQVKQKGKVKGFPYSEVAFMLVRPPKKKVVSTHQIRNKSEHTKLVEDAKAKGLYVYYADVVKRNGKYFVGRPWIIDWDSMPTENEVSEKKSSALECPFCNKTMSSTPGRTLHVKSKHPDRLDEYKRMT